MRGLVELQFVPTKQQVADFLTKNLPGPDFQWCRGACGLYVEGEHVEEGDGVAYGKGGLNAVGDDLRGSVGI